MGTVVGTAAVAMGDGGDDGGNGTRRDSKAHGAYMGPIWGRQDTVGPHVGPMNLAIYSATTILSKFTGRVTLWSIITIYILRTPNIVETALTR